MPTGSGSMVLDLVSKTEPSKSWPSSIEIVFKDLSCSVKHGFNYFSNDMKEILHGVSGVFKSGQLTAIMGPSGAGKSTLLNILAGYKKEGFTGSVELTGAGGCRRCYIMQEESLHPLLTVAEIMSIAASLKLPPRITRKQREHRVSEVLDSLGLSGQMSTLTLNLSGGQKKRLGIALELLDNPKVMFFDEPTSGLDSSSTKQCIKLLKELSRQGRVVVCTLHQPSASVFNSLDQVYCLASGYCAFSGSPSNLAVYLGEQGLCCPQYHNPSDFLMEVCSGDYGDYVPTLTESCQNGRSLEWLKLTDMWSENLLSNECRGAELDEVLRGSGCCSGAYPSSFLTQTRVLIRRICITLSRDQFLMHTRLLIHGSIAVLLGIFFYNIGRDAGMVYNNYNVLFFSILFLSFSALQSMSIAFPLEVPIIRKEHFNSWYSVKAYYLASTLADLPIQLSCVILYCSIVYWMSGQPMEWERFGMFTFTAVLTSLLAQTLGYLVGASMKVMNGVMLGPLTIMPWVVFSGFFLQAKDSPEWSRWLYTVSWLRRGIEGLTTAVYGYHRGRLPCISEDYCHYVSPRKFLKEIEMNDHSFGYNVLFILIMCVVLKFLTYAVLRYQLRHSR